MMQKFFWDQTISKLDTNQTDYQKCIQINQASSKASKQPKQSFQEKESEENFNGQTCLLYPYLHHHIKSKQGTFKIDYEKCLLCNVTDQTSFNQNKQVNSRADRLGGKGIRKRLH